MRDILEKEAVHIFQPEPLANGGIMETLRAAFLAELHHILIAPHHACGLVALAACAHINACIPNLLIQECNVNPDAPIMKACFPEADYVQNGRYVLTEAPGLGIEFDESAASTYCARPYDRPIVFLPDGSVGLE